MDRYNPTAMAVVIARERKKSRVFKLLPNIFRLPPNTFKLPPNTFKLPPNKNYFQLLQRSSSAASAASPFENLVESIWQALSRLS